MWLYEVLSVSFNSILPGRAWASPTLAGLHCKTCVNVCLSAYVWPYTENLNWTNGNEGTRTFQICTHAKAFYCSVRWIMTEDSSPCNSTPMNLERQIASGARLQRWRQREQEGRRSERTEVRQARLDRWRIHGEESVTFSGSISVELDSDGSIMSTCTEHWILKMLYHSTTHQWHKLYSFISLLRLAPTMFYIF